MRKVRMYTSLLCSTNESAESDDGVASKYKEDAIEHVTRARTILINKLGRTSDRVKECDELLKEFSKVSMPAPPPPPPVVFAKPKPAAKPKVIRRFYVKHQLTKRRSRSMLLSKHGQVARSLRHHHHHPLLPRVPRRVLLVSFFVFLPVVQI